MLFSMYWVDFCPQSDLAEKSEKNNVTQTKLFDVSVK